MKLTFCFPQIGLYVVVSLFGLYAEALREMSGPQISNWIETIAKGVDDKWFLKLPFSNEGSVRTTVPAANISWDAFIRGWIHAAEGKIVISRLIFSLP